MNITRNGLRLLLIISLFSMDSCKKNNPNPSQVPPSTVTDYDGNVYHTVVIGTQLWLVENLKTTHYRNGFAIPLITDPIVWQKLNSDGCCMYDENDVIDLAIYGRLYNWEAVSSSNNMAPTGWHVASMADWTTLINYLGGASIAGSKLKETGTIHWQSPNSDATNTSGFTALPGGYTDGTHADSSGHPVGTGFSSIGAEGYWWTSDGDGYVIDASGNLTTSLYTQGFGFSVRCVHD